MAKRRNEISILIEDVRNTYNTAADLATSVVEKLAREILTKHRKKYDCFVCAMGGVFFGQRRDDVNFDLHERPEFRLLCEFFDEFDEYFKLSGIPLHLSIDLAGTITKKTDW